MGLSWPVPGILSARIRVHCRTRTDRSRKKPFNTRMKLAINATAVLWFGKVGGESLFLPAKTIPVAATLDQLALELGAPNRGAMGNWWNESPREGGDSMVAIVTPSANLSPGHSRLTRLVRNAAMATWWSARARKKNIWPVRLSRVDIKKVRNPESSPQRTQLRKAHRA